MNESEELESFWDEQFNRQVNSPTNWFLTAKQLMVAYRVLAEHANNIFESRMQAQSLEESFNTLPTSLMLAGYSIENYLKGIIIKNNPPNTFVKNGSFSLKQHRLDELAEKANLSISTKEKELLNTLHDYVMVYGRYPVPLNQKNMSPCVAKQSEIDGKVENIIVPKHNLLYSIKEKRYFIFEEIDSFFKRIETLN